jgi:hypothetical protein
MITNFNIELSNTSFEFITMNRVWLQLYQVHVLNEGKKARFHMQINDKDHFVIVDKASCPDQFQNLETTFSDANHP